MKEMTNGGNRRKPGHALVVEWLNDIFEHFTTQHLMVQRSFFCCGLNHPSIPSTDINYAAGLNGRLKDILFIRGSNYDRDRMLHYISTFAFESVADLSNHIQTYLQFEHLNNNVVESGVSLLDDARVIVGMPRQPQLNFGMDQILNK